MSHDTVTGAIFAAVPDHARPMLTYYNESTGERTELSGATLGNWAAKIANYLRDGLGLAPGDRVRVDLPEHWQTAAVLLGAWWAGVAVDLSDDAADDRATFTSRERVDEHDTDEVIAVPLDPFAMGVRDLPVGVEDFGESVRAHGDQFVPAGSGRDAVDEVTVAQVLSAADGGLDPADRLLTTRGWRTVTDVVANLAAPLLSGASLVVVAGDVEDSRLRAIAETEKATVVRT
ncbi:TIGR03089 family protein [Gordonia sihwensis]|uniref:TIGR03089 family protein n=1 Tax=Gordonia sihwensis TaxID=173559 RepID=UPI001C930162|nr:TIGR03089 family protein [Gordonia sihwensis]MBY4569515.1 TIGR03089 family protein [Gordonia sihwensis]